MPTHMYAVKLKLYLISEMDKMFGFGNGGSLSIESLIRRRYESPQHDSLEKSEFQ